MESAVYSRKLFEVWGLSELEQGEESDYESLGIVRGVHSELERENLHDLPKLVRKLRGLSRDGPVMMRLGRAVVSYRIFIGNKLMETKALAEAFLDVDGRIWLVGDEKFEELVRM